MMTWPFNVGRRVSRLRSLCGVLPLLVLFTVVTNAPASAAPQDPNKVSDRGEALVVVQANVIDSSKTDTVNISITGSMDEQRLREIADVLGEKFNAKPADLVRIEGDPSFFEKKTVGFDLQLPVVPRGEGYLPVAPFIEAFAPHVSRLRIAYLIQGQFTYRGYQKFERSDVTFTVDPPEVSPANSPVPTSFYGVNVIIKSPTLSADPIPHYPKPKTPWGIPPWLLIIVIGGLVGAAVGVFLTMFLPHKRSAKSKQTGDHHDTTRN